MLELLRIFAQCWKVPVAPKIPFDWPMFRRRMTRTFMEQHGNTGIDELLFVNDLEVIHLVYTERVGSSIPSPPTISGLMIFPAHTLYQGGVI
jgi:hypothetical protein